mmetsp:Transcript_4853/g.14596  ORF Transcript_4853/g.14596 Transcript_4853/m.14596 type:complete len:274 (-) Transcript_4853:42-863(-)
MAVPGSRVAHNLVAPGPRRHAMAPGAACRAPWCNLAPGLVRRAQGLRRRAEDAARHRCRRAAADGLCGRVAARPGGLHCTPALLARAAEREARSTRHARQRCVVGRVLAGAGEPRGAALVPEAGALEELRRGAEAVLFRSPKGVAVLLVQIRADSSLAQLRPRTCLRGPNCHAGRSTEAVGARVHQGHLVPGSVATGAQSICFCIRPRGVIPEAQRVRHAAQARGDRHRVRKGRQVNIPGARGPRRPSRGTRGGAGSWPPAHGLRGPEDNGVC